VTDRKGLRLVVNNAKPPSPGGSGVTWRSNEDGTYLAAVNGTITMSAREPRGGGYFTEFWMMVGGGVDDMAAIERRYEAYIERNRRPFDQAWPMIWPD
jgi:hypothetical protein